MSRSQEIAREGRRLVIEELSRQGVPNVKSVKVGQQPLVVASNVNNSKTVRIRVKTRGPGTGSQVVWMASIRDGNPDAASDDTYWVFVDLLDGGSGPAYYVVPDRWMRTNIQQEHQKYLGTQPGWTRPRNRKSTHHSIGVERIEQWADRWDLLPVFQED